MSGSDHVKPASPGLKLTYDDFVLFPDDGMLHELIDGHHVTPSPNMRHRQISINLTLMIGGWLEAHPQGRLFHAPLDVVFSNFDVVDPDIEVVRVYRRNGDRFAKPVELSREAGEVLTTSLLPGLELPLARIFRE
jgi:hypothetical protein